VDGEVVVERRRQWTAEQKAALVAEVEAEGGQVSVVARRHGVSASLLYNWTPRITSSRAPDEVGSGYWRSYSAEAGLVISAFSDLD